MVGISSILIFILLLSLGQLILLFWFRVRLHHVTFLALSISHSIFSLLLILMIFILKVGTYASIPSSVRLVILFALFILPGCLLLTQAGSFLYAILNRKFPYMFLQYADHGNYYVTQLRRNRNEQLKQLDIQWTENMIVTIPVTERIVFSKHGKYHFESYKIDSQCSLLLRFDWTTSNHYVFFPKATYSKLADYINNQNFSTEVSYQEGAESELLFRTEDREYKLIVDTFVLFDFPNLLSLLERNNILLLSPKVFDSFPYHKVRQPQYREALSIINNVLQNSSRIYFGEPEASSDKLDVENNEIDRLISIALTEHDKGNTVYMLTSNNKLKLKCRHYNISFVDAHSIMKMYNTSSNPIHRLTFIPQRSI